MVVAVCSNLYTMNDISTPKLTTTRMTAVAAAAATTTIATAMVMMMMMMMSVSYLWMRTIYYNRLLMNETNCHLGCHLQVQM